MGSIVVFFFCAFSTVTLVCPCEVKVTTTACPSEKDTAQLVTAINELKNMLTCPGGSLVDQLRVMHTRLQAAEEKLQAFENAESENDTLKNELCLCNSTRECRQGWLKFQNSCYRRVLKAANYTDAKSRCEDEGAILAEITSSEENDFLKNQLLADVKDFSFFGVNDIESEGDWVLTSSGLPVNFTDWHRINGRQPDNYKDAEDCGVLSSPSGTFVGWNDMPCKLAHPYLCEYSLL